MAVHPFAELAGRSRTTVAPGNIKTPMHSAETYAQLEALEPTGHLGEIADIVDAIIYLEGAGFVTGEILHVDGGQSAGH